MSRFDWPETLFLGGRHLSAISRNSALNSKEKLIMHEIAGLLWSGKEATYEDTLEIYMDELCFRTSLSRSSVQRAVAALDRRGYLIRKLQKTEKGQLNKKSLFMLTDKIFIEYATNYPNVIPLNRRRPISQADQG